MFILAVIAVKSIAMIAERATVLNALTAEVQIILIMTGFMQNNSKASFP
jgi:hypothetical protein